MTEQLAPTIDLRISIPVHTLGGLSDAIMVAEMAHVYDVAPAIDEWTWRFPMGQYHRLLLLLANRDPTPYTLGWVNAGLETLYGIPIEVERDNDADVVLTAPIETRPARTTPLPDA